MKKINVLLLLLALILTACKKEVLLKESTTLFSAKTNNGKLSSRPLNPGDINLDVNWDWTQHSWTAYFNNANGSVGSVTTLNPFIDGAQKVYGNVDISKADMYPSKGWMLVSRDFGTPTEANAYPFLLLYNKYRGVLRICVLRTYDVQSSYQQITLSYANNSSYPNFFDYSQTFDPKLFEFNSPVNTTNSEYKQTAVTSAGVQEWMIADFDVKKYNETFDDNTSFNISISEVSQSDIVLNGNIQLDGTAQPQAGGTDVVGKINNLSNFYTSTKDGLSKVLAIPKANIEDIVNGGAGLLLKTILKAVSGFSGGSDGVPYNIKLKGTINQTGSIKLNSPKTSFSVYLKPKTNTSAYRAVQNIPWGVFTIGNLSKVSDNVTDYYSWEPNSDGTDYYEVMTGYVREMVLAPNFITNSNFKINPAIIDDIEKIEIVDIVGQAEYGIGTFQANYSDFVLLDNYQASSKSFTSYNSMLIKFGIKITFNNGIVVYQVIPST